MPSKWIYFSTMEEIQCIKYENYHLYTAHACDKKTSSNFNLYSLLNLNQKDGQNNEEKLDTYTCCDEQSPELSYDWDSYSYENSQNSQNSVLDFDPSDGQDDEEGSDTLKESGEEQRLLCKCETNLQSNLKILEPAFKLSPDSDEFIEEVERMFAEPTGDIAILHSLFPHV